MAWMRSPMAPSSSAIMKIPLKDTCGAWAPARLRSRVRRAEQYAVERRVRMPHVPPSDHEAGGSSEQHARDFVAEPMLVRVHSRECNEQRAQKGRGHHYGPLRRRAAREGH